MLILSRKRGQSIVLNDSIEIFVTAIEGDQVKIGIVAPKDINIIRKEVIEDVKAVNRNAMSSIPDLELFKEWEKSTKKNK
ncbi:carbon storage regulator [Paenibacillus sp. NPDC057967]|uniref:carbon storage regulator n=1 Tax=Paenibacillus sp. NPDC057967 TaxID=3346293 RepID=UPI0036DDF58F